MHNNHEKLRLNELISFNLFVLHQNICNLNDLILISS